MSDLKIEIRRTDEKLHFDGISDSNPNITVPFDFTPPMGEGKGFTGLELLLMSFAGCVSTTVVFLLKRSDKLISSYRAEIEGIRTEQPLALKKINMKIYIESANTTETDMENIIKQAEAISPVWKAIKDNIEVTLCFDLLHN